MNKVILGMGLALLAVPATAHAEGREGSKLSGPHVGISVVRDSLEANQPTSTRDVTRNAVGVRGHAGYDAVLGNTVLIGAEIGVGTGGRTVTQASLAGGRYNVRPGITYDATARLGIVPTDGFAIYGRAGYRWLRTEQSVSGQAANNFTLKRTEGGFTYGAGAEFAVVEGVSLRAEFNRTSFSKDLRQNKISLGASIRF